MVIVSLFYRACVLYVCVRVWLSLLVFDWKRESDKYSKFHFESLYSILLQYTVLLHAEDVVYLRLAGTCCKNFNTSQTSCYVKIYKNILVSYPYSLFFSFISKVATIQPGTHCSFLMYSRVWKHKAAVYTVHKSNLAHTTLLHPVLKPFTTVHRPLGFFFFTRWRKTQFMLTQVWSEMMYSRHS